MLSGIKDVDKEILLRIDSDADFLKMRCINSYFLSLYDEQYFQRRLKYKYPGTIEYKYGEWKYFYFHTSHYIAKLKKEGFDYEKYGRGNPEKIFYKINRYRDTNDWGLFEAARKRKHDLVDYYISKTTVSKHVLNYGLIGAAMTGDWNVINFLISKGADDWKKAMINSIDDDVKHFFRQKMN